MILLITKEWLERIGFTTVDGIKFHHPGSSNSRKWCLVAGDNDAYAFVCMGTCFSVQKTRQDVLQLCDVMAVTIVE